MTYNVCCGMLNLSQSMSAELHLICVVYMKQERCFLTCISDTVCTKFFDRLPASKRRKIASRPRKEKCAIC